MDEAAKVDRVDLLIVVILIFAVLRGARSGFIQLIFSTTGFLIGLFLGSWISVKLLKSVSVPVTKLLLILVIEVALTITFSWLGELIGVHLSRNLNKIHLSRPNQIFGSIFEFIATLVIIWLVASGLTHVSADNIGYYTQRSLIVRSIDKTLPQAPDLFARVERALTPNGYPNVFVGLEPNHTTLPPTNPINNQAISADEASVVKVEGRGCGGTVEGSGFVAAKGIVVTNAHVIAGIPNPSVIDGSGSFPATPIWFDPNLDLAVLRVNGLSDKSINLSSSTLGYRDPGVIMGFPGNSSALVTGNATIIDQVDAIGQNIYNQGQVSRQIYELEANVEPGNSGGPLIDSNGDVAGIVFAKSQNQPEVGYALVINDIKSELTQAENQNSQVTVGECTSD